MTQNIFKLSQNILRDTLVMDEDLVDWLDETGAWDEFNEWMDDRNEARTVMQRHSNCMLRMRRIMKEIALIMNLQDPDYEITDDETQRILQCAGWDELRTARALKGLMEKINV